MSTVGIITIIIVVLLCIVSPDAILEGEDEE
jgi:hypothetical protein